MNSRLYTDNAATSFPKPPCVIEAMRDYAESLGASAGRGAYREAVETGERVAACRRGLAKLFNAENAKQIVFGLNCTDLLNLAIHGTLQPGDHAIASRMDHNSVLRPLKELESKGVQVTLVSADAESGQVRAADIVTAIRPTTKLIALQHASNVTGTIQPIAEVGRAAREHDILYLVDAAQTAGRLPIDVQAMHIDLLAFPGHKELLGPLGTGGLYLRPGIEPRVRPLKQGGTGSVSEEPIHPSFMPDRYESGSHNAIGICGLGAAVDWILERGIDSLAAHDRELCRHFIEKLRGIDNVKIFGPLDPTQRVSVFSVRVQGFDPAELAAVLETDFAILSRSGITCAPLAHETIGTHRDGGTTRLSFGPFTKLDDVTRCTDALTEIAASVSVSAP